ncbi:anti-sigma factor [Devosia rhodophyticola]|uniref:Anti-sigma factor n=1 Tax=Devosia rhodophyticola TaxID=3026423 RepID=A0ABY7YZB0_9HYPH|nr:anti-sigma factor [Devosia rhodophyticola]WDR06725.1 anti-sigma factor [Devosia rhodophyticola]
MSTSDDIGDPVGGNALVAEFVLGLLDSAEHERVAKLIRDDPRLQAEQHFWESRFAALNAEYEEVAVPAHLINAIEARAFGDAVGRQKSRLWDSLILWRGLAAGALAVAVVAIGMNAGGNPGTNDAASLATQLVAALELDGSSVKFVALYDSATGTVRLTSLSGEPVPDKDFELWAIQGGNNPISMGVVPVNQRTQVTLSPDVMAGWGAGSVLAITLEPKGGSPTGDPTGPIVAKGSVTQI